MASSRNIKSGILWSSISSFSRYALQFGGIMILARLLTPEDYGLIGLMTVFISVADVIIDSGLSGAIIKKENATNIDFKTLTTFNLIVSIFIYLLFFINAPLLAAYYDKPDLSILLRVYGLYILIFALSVSPKARLTKDLRFKTISIINIVSGITGLVTAIVMALNGYGPMSLVGQYLANAFVSTTLIIFLSNYKITFGFSYKSFKDQFSFGVNTTLANTLKSLSENIYNNVIGKSASIIQTGYYSQATKLMNVPVGFFFNVIDGTYFPVMSQIHDKEEFAKSIQSLNFRTETFVIILFTTAISLNKEIVYILLGEKWLEASWTLAMLFAAGLFITWGNLGRNIIKSLGKTFLILKYETVIFIASLLGLLLCAKYGYEVIVICFLIVSLLKSIYINFLAGKEINITLYSQIKSVAILSILSLFLLVGTSYVEIDNIWLSLVCKGVLLCVAYFLYIMKYNQSLLKKFIKHGSRK